MKPCFEPDLFITSFGNNGVLTMGSDPLGSDPIVIYAIISVIIFFMDGFLLVGGILVVALLLAVVAEWLGLPYLLGYMLAGIFLGSQFLGIISAGTFSLFADIGISLLLFVVGLSLSGKAVREVGYRAALLGLVQVAVTSVLGFGLAGWLGFGTIEAAYLALALAMSSTIITSKILAEKKDLGKLYAKVGIAILLVQDICAALILAGVSIYGRNLNLGNALTLFAIKLVTLTILVLFFTEYIFKPLLAKFSGSQEFLFIATVGFGIGVAGLYRGLGLSMEVGALVAGISLASSMCSFEIAAKAKFVRDFFMIFFFLALGAQIQLTSVALIPLLCLVGFVLVIKTGVIGLILKTFGYSLKIDLLTAFSLTPVSEFALVLLALGLSLGHLSNRAFSLMSLTMLVTIPPSVGLVYKNSAVANWLFQIFKVSKRSQGSSTDKSKNIYNAYLLGCHRLGRDFLRTLQRAQLKFLVIDFDPEIISKLEHEHIPNLYGDIDDLGLIEELNLEKAKLVISTVPDFDSTLFFVNHLRRRNKKCLLISSAHTVAEAQILYKHGVDYVVLPHFLGGNLAALMISKYGLNSRSFAKERQKHLIYLDSIE